MGPFRPETLRVNWSYLRHSHCFVSGQSHNGIRYGGSLAYPFPPPQGDPQQRPGGSGILGIAIDTFRLYCLLPIDPSTIPNTAQPQLGTSKAYGLRGYCEACATISLQCGKPVSRSVGFTSSARYLENGSPSTWPHTRTNGPGASVGY